MPLSFLLITSLKPILYFKCGILLFQGLKHVFIFILTFDVLVMKNGVELAEECGFSILYKYCLNLYLEPLCLLKCQTQEKTKAIVAFITNNKELLGFVSF